MSAGSQRVVWYRDTRVLSVLFQILAVAAFVGVLTMLGLTAAANLKASSFPLNPSFFWQPSGVQMAFTPFWDFVFGESQYWEVFLVGAQNTLLVGLIGIILATLLGFVIGVARFSDNYFLNKAATIYVEIFRNIPLLLQVFVWNFVIILPALPPVRESWSLFGALFANQRGVSFATFGFTESWVWQVFLAMLIAVGFGVWRLRRWAKRRFFEQAKPFPVFWAGIAVFAAAVLLFFLVFAPYLTLDIPEAKGFRFVGGWLVPVAFFSLLLGLVCYTSAFIAENVRAGLHAVNKGQIEAARSLGLSQRLTLKLILTPQALRVIIPPTISQYLNLIKNSSLGIAIGYPDMVTVWTNVTLNQTGQALIIIATTMVFYTCVSLTTSLILNVYNRRTQLVER